MVLVVLLLELLIPHLNLMSKTHGTETISHRWVLPSVLVVVSSGFLVAGSLTSGFDINHRQSNSVFYVLNADTREAIWASLDKKPDAWTSQFFSAGAEKGKLDQFVPLQSMDILKGPAPVMSLAAPNMVRLDDNTSDGVQTVRMRLTSPRQVPLLLIFVGSNTKVLAAMVNGKRIDTGEPPAPLEGGKRWGLFYWGLPKEGIELTLEVNSSAPLEIVVVDTSYGLPQIPTMSFKARPNSMMPAPFPFLSDMTLVSKSFAF